MNDRAAIVSAVGLIGCIVAAGVPWCAAQPGAPRPEFEVASIKRNVEGGLVVFNGMRSPGTFASQNQTLKNLIQEAYGIPSGRRDWLPFFVAPGQGLPIFGGSDWVGSERYDITAKWNARLDAHPTMRAIQQAESEMDLMLRSLLEDRFRVKVHRETRELPVYELTVSKAGKLGRGSCNVFDPNNAPQLPLGQQPPSYCGGSTIGRKGPDWTLDGAGMKMGELADSLSFLIGTRHVIDKTGFRGVFDAHLQWTPGPGEYGANWNQGASTEFSQSIFTVIENQLGLRLKAGRDPVEVIVIDRAERPSPN